MNEAITPTCSLTIGIDVSDRESHICVLDENGKVLVRDRVPTEPGRIKDWFRGWAPCRVALEVGRHSPWMSRLLKELGHEVIVANARQVKLIHQSTNKNDPVDAEKLARLARFDPELLYPIEHRREATQAALAIVRSRELVVKQRTMLINSVRAQVRAIGSKMPAGHAMRFDLLRDEIPELLRDALDPLMDLIKELGDRIAHYNRVIEDLCQEVYPKTELLRQIWGVGPVTSLGFMLTVEDPERFPSSRAVGSYFGLRPRQDQSGDVDKHLHVTKEGDRMMRHLLVQCAQRVICKDAPDSDLKRWAQRYIGPGDPDDKGKKLRKRKALVAVARKLAVLFHHLWLTAEVYEPLYNTKRREQAA